MLTILLVTTGLAVLALMAYGLWAFPKVRHHIIPATSGLLVLILYWFPIETSLVIPVTALSFEMVRHSPLGIEAQLYLRNLIISCPEAKLRHEGVRLRMAGRHSTSRELGGRVTTIALIQRIGGQWTITIDKPELSALSVEYMLSSGTPQPWQISVHNHSGKQSLFLDLIGLRKIILEETAYRVKALNSDVAVGSETIVVGPSPQEVVISSNLGTPSAIEFPEGGCDGGYLELELDQYQKGRSEEKVAFRDGYRFSNLKVTGVKGTSQADFYEQGIVQELKNGELVLSPDGVKAVLTVRGRRSAFSFVFANENVLGVLLGLAIFWGGLVAANGLVLRE